jgi:RNA polymerase sigma-54 factor
MTPQLQQAIRLLQLSTVELQLEIQQALESNLMLELAEEEGEERFAPGEMLSPLPLENGAADNNEAYLTEGETSPREFPEESAVDSAWEDIYDSAAPHTQSSDLGERNYESQDSATESLREHLYWQMRLTPFSDTDRMIAMGIIDSIMDDGYLGDSLENICAGLQHELDDDEVVNLDEAEAVLHRIQNFDPMGVAARDLPECLLIQLHHYDPATPGLEQARSLIKSHLDLLASRDYGQLLRQLKLTEAELRQAVTLIQALSPRPGGQITDSRPQYITPDVYVKKHRNSWRVELNLGASPRVRINSQYANLIRRADNSADNSYLKNHLQEARWFIKSLKSRNETLLKVATCIVERQRAFLEQGEEAMQPMVLHDVAEAVGMHESTISRVTTQKYMHTPRGIFELKYFFSSHVSTTLGGECSATAIRAFIKKMVASEEATKPLSDSKIAGILLTQNINVARRTVAKYRESLAIPPSNERKRLR